MIRLHDRDRQTDFSPLLPEAEKDPAFASFRKAMEGRVYGGEALSDAWGWFSAGWHERDALRDPMAVEAAAPNLGTMADRADQQSR